MARAQMEGSCFTRISENTDFNDACNMQDNFDNRHSLPTEQAGASMFWVQDKLVTSGNDCFCTAL